MTTELTPSASHPPPRRFGALQAPMRAYVSTVVALGAVVLFAGLANVPLDRVWLVAGLLAASVLTSAVKVSLPLPKGHSTLSLSYIVNFSAVLCLEPAAVAPIAAATAWSQCTIKVNQRNPIYQTLFSMATLAVTAGTSAWVFQAVRPFTAGSDLGAAAVAATSYFLLNTVLVASAIALSTRDGLGRVWTQNFLWSSPTYYIGALLAVLAVALAREGGLAWVVALSAPAYLSYRSYKAYTDRVSQEHQQVREASDLQLKVIEALAFAIEAKDGSTPDHVLRMQVYGEGLAQAIGLGDDEVRAVRTAALLHDVGNLGVPEHILSRPGPLTKAEFDRVKLHPRVGADIVKSVPFSTAVSPLILAHHERWDGRGYPLGLKGTEIPVGARILSVVDCFAAMLSERPHRPARPYAEAIVTLRETAGAALDPDLVETFVNVLPSLESTLQTARSRVAAIAEAAPHAKASALEHIASAHREEQALHDVSQALSATLSMADVVALVSTHVVSLVPFTSSSVFLFEEVSGLFLCRQATGAHQDAIRAVTASTVEGLEKTLPDTSSKRVPGVPPRLRSALVAPLQQEGRAIGALAFYHADPDAYTADHRRLVARVAAQAAPVVAHAILFERAREQSLTDPLTGLANRRAIEHQLSQELSRAQRHSGQVSVLLFDMDGFKAINDVYGHQAGDRALQDTAQCLRAGLRDYDQCARFDGDEFVVVLSDCDQGHAERRRQAIQRDVGALVFEPVPGQRVALGISGGAATFPTDGVTPQELIAAADGRMYRDKSVRTAGAERRSDAPAGVRVGAAAERIGP